MKDSSSVEVSRGQLKLVEVSRSQMTVSGELVEDSCKGLVVESLVVMSCKQRVANRVVEVEPYREIIRISNRHSHILIIYLNKSPHCSIPPILYIYNHY